MADIRGVRAWEERTPEAAQVRGLRREGGMKFFVIESDSKRGLCRIL